MKNMYLYALGALSFFSLSFGMRNTQSCPNFRIIEHVEAHNVCAAESADSWFVKKPMSDADRAFYDSQYNPSVRPKRDLSEKRKKDLYKRQHNPSFGYPRASHDSGLSTVPVDGYEVDTCFIQ